MLRSTLLFVLPGFFIFTYFTLNQLKSYRTRCDTRHLRNYNSQGMEQNHLLLSELELIFLINNYNDINRNEI
jgi:hypothetical protein